MNLLEELEREVKEDTTRPAKERVILWRCWDKIVNMKAAEVRSFRDSEFGQTVGLDKKEAEAAGNNVKSGQEASKDIEKMIAKASSFRGQHKKLPNWTKEEWALAGRQIGFISRFRSNIGDLKDEEDKPTPKAGAMMLWGRDEIKAPPSSWPDKEKIKEEVKEEYKKQKDEEQKIKDKKEEKEDKKKPLQESYHAMANYLLTDI